MHRHQPLRRCLLLGQGLCPQTIKPVTQAWRTKSKWCRPPGSVAVIPPLMGARQIRARRPCHSQVSCNIQWEMGAPASRNRTSQAGCLVSRRGDAQDACDKGMGDAEARCGTNCLQLSSLQSSRDVALPSYVHKDVARNLAAAQVSEDDPFSVRPEPLPPSTRRTSSKAHVLAPPPHSPQ